MGAMMFDIGVNLTSSQFSRDHDEVVIIGPGNTEYRCIGSIIWHLQRAGFRKINFQIEAGS